MKLKIDSRAVWPSLCSIATLLILISEGRSYDAMGQPYHTTAMLFYWSTLPVAGALYLLYLVDQAMLTDHTEPDKA